MAFEILGTFTASQFTRFSTWLQGQTAQATARIQHLQAEVARIGSLTFAFDAGGIPTAMTPTGTTTYIGKLVEVYEALGGDAEFDLQVRSMGQPVFQQTGTEIHMPQQMSNGEIISTPGLSDAESGALVRQARDWAYDVQFYRRDLLERKIRRMLDYVDQLQSEIATLQKIQSDQTVQGSLAFLVSGVQQLIANQHYIAAQNDASMPDPHGKFAFAPMASYMPGPDRTDTSDFQRTITGPSVPQSTDP